MVQCPSYVHNYVILHELHNSHILRYIAFFMIHITKHDAYLHIITYISQLHIQHSCLHFIDTYSTFLEYIFNSFNCIKIHQPNLRGGRPPKPGPANRITRRGLDNGGSVKFQFWALGWAWLWPRGTDQASLSHGFMCAQDLSPEFYQSTICLVHLV